MTGEESLRATSAAPEHDEGAAVAADENQRRPSRRLNLVLTIGAVLTTLIGVPIIAHVWRGLFITPIGWPSPTQILIGLPVAAVMIGLCGAAIRGHWRSRSRITALLLLFAAFVWIPVSSVYWVGIWTKNLCGVAPLHQSLALRSMGEMAQREASDQNASEGSLLATMLGLYDLPPSTLYESWANDPCTGLRIRNIRVGTVTLGDVAAGRASVEELDAEIRRVSAGLNGWETIGIGAVCRSPAVLKLTETERVVAYMFVNNPRLSEVLLVSTHMQTRHWYRRDNESWPSESRTLVLDSVRWSRQNSLPEPPAELLDFMGITEAEIGDGQP